MRNVGESPFEIVSAKCTWRFEINGERAKRDGIAMTHDTPPFSQDLTFPRGTWVQAREQATLLYNQPLQLLRSMYSFIVDVLPKSYNWTELLAAEIIVQCRSSGGEVVHAPFPFRWGQ